MSQNVDYSDLDALVVAEFDALQGDSQAPCKRPWQRSSRERNAGPEPARVLERGTRSPVTPIRVENPVATAQYRGEEFNGLFDDPQPCGSDQGEVRDSASPESLLRHEDEAFIARAVGFLSQREHADVILGHIWEKLTELDPDAFYQAPAAAEPAQGTKDAAGTSEGPSPEEDTPEETAS